MEKKKKVKKILYSVMRVSIQQLLMTSLFFTMSYANDVSAQDLLNRAVTISAYQTKLETVLEQISNQTNVSFIYSHELIRAGRPVSVNVKNAKLKDVLRSVIIPLGIDYSIGNKKTILLKKNSADKSVSPLHEVVIVKRKLTGKITDDKGEGLAGVNVLVKDSQNGAISGKDGFYSLELPEGDQTIIFSCMGYVSEEALISAQRSIFNITLKADERSLKEVLVVGYGTQTKSSLTGAVGSVKGVKVSEVGVSNFTDALQGRIAGVDIQTSRYPGDNREILIRGVRSLNAGNSPLIIIDGVPGDLNTLNPYDVESLEVLKDASASAVYGSRGANGVIIVTTKRGKGEQKTTVNYNAYFGTVNPNLFELQSPEQYLQFRRDNYRMSNGWDKPFTDADIFLPGELEVIKNGNYVNWEKLLYRNGVLQNHSLSINHGDEKTKLNLSLTYNGESGYYKNNEQTKLNFSANVDHMVTKWFNIGLSSRIQSKNIDGFNSYGADFSYMTPLSQPYKEDGSFNFFPVATNSSSYNVLANYLPGAYINESKENSTNLTFYTELKFSKNLSMRTNVGLINEAYRRGFYYSPESYVRKGAKSNSGKNYDNHFEYTVNNTLTYQNTWGEHTFTTDLVGEMVKSKSDITSASGINQPVGSTGYDNLGTNGENIAISSDYSSWSLLSGLGRVRYDFKGKYFFNAAIRADGSSRLAVGNQWSYFPSGGVGWLLSEEDFYKVDWLNTLKIRASYGAVGNTAISPYQTLLKLAKRDYLFGETDKYFVYRPSSIPSPNLGWEVSRTVNFGVDFGMLNNKLSGYVEVYNTHTKDILLQRSIPELSGYASVWQNIGSTQNRGVELNLQSRIISRSKFRWNASANFALNREKIVSLIGEKDIVGNSWFIGKPIGVRYDYEFAGIWQLNEAEEAAKYLAKPGYIKIKDQNGDGKIDAQNDRVILGTTRPLWIGSFGSELKYGNISLNFSLNARWKYLVKPAIYSNHLITDGLRWLPANIDYWTPETPSNQYQKADRGDGYDPYRASSGFMRGDHVKLQDLTIAYDFRQHLPKVLSMTNARIYFQMKNAFYLYRATPKDVTPEAAELDMNIPSTYLLGLSIGF